MDADEIKDRVNFIQCYQLEKNSDNVYIFDSYVKPFRGNSETKLILIGQDPTIRNEKSRVNVKCTLNLDKPNGALYKYVEHICEGLGMSVDNVYATNLFKYMYTVPPASTMHVLGKDLQPNLQLLIEEIEAYRDSIVITLGEPVLQLLTDNRQKVRNYWGYEDGTYSNVTESKLKGPFYPFPHQPSLRKDFYRKNLNMYIDFVKKEIMQ